MSEKEMTGKTNHIRCTKCDLPCEITSPHGLEQFDRPTSWQAVFLEPDRTGRSDCENREPG